MRTPVILIVGAPSRERDACEALLHRMRLRCRVTEPYAHDLQAVHGGKADVCVAICDNFLTAVHEVRLYHEVWQDLPLLVLDATPGGHLTVSLLDAGADDVLRPHQAMTQLGARVRALFRRTTMDSKVSGNVSLVAGNIKIDPAAHRVWIGAKEVPFSPTEFLILQKLCLHSGRVVPYREIFIAVWGEFRPDMAEGLRVYIRHIRLKMQTAAETVSIVTRPGIGYMLSVGGRA